MADDTALREPRGSVVSGGKSEKPKSWLGRFVSLLGPGLITGASDDDPSGIGTYAQAGAALGFSCLWMALFTFPLMTVAQYVCAKIGLVRGRGLAGVLRKQYPHWVVYSAVAGLVVANTINAGADLGAIGAAAKLLWPKVPLIRDLAIIGSSIAIVLVMAFGTYKSIERVFKWLTLSLFAYIGTAFFVHADWKSAIYHTVVPTIQTSSSYLAVLVGFLGTTISPYLFFWQSDLEVEQSRADGGDAARQRDRSSFWRQKSCRSALADCSIDTAVGMFFSNLVAYFIVFTTAATLHTHGVTNISTADQAALALRPLAGNWAFLLFALGLIGTGFLAVPVLIASAAYALSESLAWKFGLEKQPQQARKFYAVIAVSALIGVLINYIGINAMAALFWTAVINGFLAPPLLVVIMLAATDRRVMGAKVLSRPTAILGWLTTLLMAAAAIAFVWTAVRGG